MMSYIEPASTCHCRRVTNGGRDARCRTAPRTRGAYAATVIARLRALAPYAAIVALPGGSLMAPLLWLYRRQARKFTADCGADSPAVGDIFRRR